MQIKFCELLSTSFLNSLQSAWDSTDPEHKRYGNKFFYNIKCYLRVTCSTNEQEVHQPKLGFTYIKTYCEKLSSINLKWEENLQYKKHEIGVRADMETAAYSEYVENHLMLCMVHRNSTWQKFTSLVFFQGTTFHCSFPLIFQGYQLHFLMHGIFLNPKIHGTYAHGLSS